jgi:hypothetical protein
MGVSRVSVWYLGELWDAAGQVMGATTGKAFTQHKTGAWVQHPLQIFQKPVVPP